MKNPKVSYWNRQNKVINKIRVRAPFFIRLSGISFDSKNHQTMDYMGNAKEH